MRIMIFVFLSALFISIDSSAMTLNCQGGKCHSIDGGNWCTQDIGAIASGVYSTKNMILSDDHKNLIAVFPDGDQFTTVTFKNDEIFRLNIGDKIFGIYSDNFWWSDGDHTRFTIDLDCKRVN